ncbi:MAG: DUF6037 family protein [Clostridiales bacterium]|nr:DUF6037 family protein [Clostridiales bacterium]
MASVPNIMILRNKLRDLGWKITAFDFKYNSKEYVVLFKNQDSDGKRIDKYGNEKNIRYIALLTFIDKNNIERILQFRVNSGWFDIHFPTFCSYFKISYLNKSHGKFFSQFRSSLNSSIPQNPINNFKHDYTPEIKKVIAKNYFEENGEKLNRIYCFGIMRNGKTKKGEQKYRTTDNANFTILMRPELFEYFKDDKTISFCFTDDESREKTDVEIIEGFSHEAEGKIPALRF